MNIFQYLNDYNTPTATNSKNILRPYEIKNHKKIYEENYEKHDKKLIGIAFFLHSVMICSL